MVDGQDEPWTMKLFVRAHAQCVVKMVRSHRRYMLNRTKKRRHPQTLDSPAPPGRTNLTTLFMLGHCINCEHRRRAARIICINLANNDVWLRPFWHDLAFRRCRVGGARTTLCLWARCVQWQLRRRGNLELAGQLVFALAYIHMVTISQNNCLHIVVTCWAASFGDYENIFLYIWHLM